MSEKFFAFKPFTIYQPFKDVMKVSTDSVLLGCYANVSDAKNALDIGCGTGILSLMLAYKNSKITIKAIDINPNAIICAKYNVEYSNYSERIEILNTSIQQFASKHHQCFDIIISNPPYFSKSFKSPNAHKNSYRHQDELNYHQLLFCISELLNYDGKFYVVVPVYEQKKFTELLTKMNLFIHSELSVFSKVGKLNPYIFIYETRKFLSSDTIKNQLFILSQENQYTLEYLEFTKEFYLYAK